MRQVIFAILLITPLGGCDQGDDRNKKNSEKTCSSTDADCLSEKYLNYALSQCPSRIEHLAQYDFKWTDQMVMNIHLQMFKGRSTTAKLPSLAYMGDQIQFQNAIGNFQRVIYTCS